MKKMLFAMLLLGCADNTLPGPSAAVTVICSQNGASCDKADQCCSGYCQLTRPYSDDWHTCAAPLTDGLYCSADNECTGRKCIDYRCGRVGACEGSSCSSDADCCRGTYCYSETYAPCSCALLAEDGAWCRADGHCRSGHCRDYSCAP
jgi:hypothetical protein